MFSHKKNGGEGGGGNILDPWVVDPRCCITQVFSVLHMCVAMTHYPDTASGGLHSMP